VLQTLEQPLRKLRKSIADILKKGREWNHKMFITFPKTEKGLKTKIRNDEQGQKVENSIKHGRY
jgi:hypothetical protein